MSQLQITREAIPDRWIPALIELAEVITAENAPQPPSKKDTESLARIAEVLLLFDTPIFTHTMPIIALDHDDVKIITRAVDGYTGFL